MMESIEKLRKWVKSLYTPNSGELKVKGLDIADEIEREIAEKYMVRPCDMDGVPVKIGDELSHYGFARNFIVHSYELTDGAWSVWDVANGATHLCQACRHVNPRTIEDVLHDFWEEWESHPIDAEWGVRLERLRESEAKYADEIRELMEVDA